MSGLAAALISAAIVFASRKKPKLSSYGAVVAQQIANLLVPSSNLGASLIFFPLHGRFKIIQLVLHLTPALRRHQWVRLEQIGRNTASKDTEPSTTS